MHDGRRSSNRRGWVKSLLDSLSLRLFVLLLAVILATFSGFAWLGMRSASRQWSQTVNSNAARFSDVIRRTTHKEMLRNDKEHVHEIVDAVAGSEGVESVRIYDKQGTIIYSAEPREIGTQVDLQAEACIRCHQSSEPMQSVPVGSRTRVFRREDGTKVLGLIDPIQNSIECSSAPCHAHPASQSVLGVLDVTMSMSVADEGLALLRRQMLWVAATLSLLAGISSAWFIVVLVRRPVQRLADGAARVSSGDLETVVPEGRGEVGELGFAFNRMTSDLRNARHELTGWSERLEIELREKTEELGRAQREMLHVEKMASLGRLAATVAHELNNPLAGILNYAKLVDRTLQEAPDPSPDREELTRFLNLIQTEAGRCGDIVCNLVAFSRRSGTEMSRHGLASILDRSLMLVRHLLKINAVDLVLDRVAGDDAMICDAHQIQQALVALLVNAVEAMPDGGTLRIETRLETDRIELTVADTGVGMDEATIQRVFEPFYSTKSDTNGAGLGLSVVYGIVRRHGGKISVESRPGEGARFHIVLPRLRGDETPARIREMAHEGGSS